MYRPIDDPSEQPYYSKDPLWFQAFNVLSWEVCETYYFRHNLQDWYHALTAGQRVGSYYIQTISDEEAHKLSVRMAKANAHTNVFHHAMYTVSNSMVQRNLHYANHAIGYGKSMKDFEYVFSEVKKEMVPLIYIMVHNKIPSEMWEPVETFY
jgi:hypothetical protein